MPYIAPEVITEAKRMDLLTYLREYEPGELVKFSSNTYTTRTHDSLKISNGKWMWWSRGIGGKSALDYLIKVRGMDFVEAVQTIMGNGSVSFPTCENIKSYENQPLLLPEKSPTTDVVFDYLFGRGIDYEIINYTRKLTPDLLIRSLARSPEEIHILLRRYTQLQKRKKHPEVEHAIHLRDQLFKAFCSMLNIKRQKNNFPSRTAGSDRAFVL